MKINILSIGALALLLIAISPYRASHINPALPCVHGNNVDALSAALGKMYRGVYPCISREFSGKFFTWAAENPSLLGKTDLRSVFPESLWPASYAVTLHSKGSDPGWANAVYAIWTLMDACKIGFVVSALKVVHLCGVFALFAVFLHMKQRLMGWLSALTFAYSPMADLFVHNFTTYLFIPVGVMCVTALAFPLRPTADSTTSVFMRAVLSVAIGFVIGIILTVRASMVLACVGLVSWFVVEAFINKKLKTLWCLAIVLFVMLGTHTLVVRQLLTPEGLAVNETGSHPFWHSLWTGLGEFPNAYGFKWEDEAPLRAVLTQIDDKRLPEEVFLTSEYNQILGQQILDTAKQHPIWLVSVPIKRMMNFSTLWIEYFPPGVRPKGVPIRAITALLLLGMLVSTAWTLWHRRDSAEAFVIYSFLVFLIEPVLIISNFAAYNLTAYVGVSLCIFYLVTTSSQAVFCRVRNRR